MEEGSVYVTDVILSSCSGESTSSQTAHFQRPSPTTSVVNATLGALTA